MILLHDSFLDKQISGTGPYYDLLREHRADFCAFFERYAMKGTFSCKVKFNSLQAKAFMLLWVDEPLPPHAGAYVIQELIAAFDKAAKEHTRKLLAQ